jgi:hypothetical protein
MMTIAAVPWWAWPLIVFGFLLAQGLATETEKAGIGAWLWRIGCLLAASISAFTALILFVRWVWRGA